MGNYLSSPKTEKFSEDGDNGTLKFGVSSMQGWRSSMEDAVNTLLGFLFIIPLPELSRFLRKSGINMYTMSGFYNRNCI